MHNTEFAALNSSCGFACPQRTPRYAFVYMWFSKIQSAWHKPIKVNEKWFEGTTSQKHLIWLPNISFPNRKRLFRTLNVFQVIGGWLHFSGRAHAWNAVDPSFNP